MKKRTSSLLFFLCLSLDQATKQLAAARLATGAEHCYLLGLVQFSYVENHYGFLGVLSSLPGEFSLFLLTWGVGILILAGLYVIVRTNWLTSRQTVAALLILAGASGNLLDRLINEGGVIDFLISCIGPFCTGIYNLADLYILTGSFSLGYAFAVHPRK